MKRWIVLTLAAALFTGLAAAQVRVGIAFDAGGKNDRSFNQMAWEGAKRAKKDFGIELFDFEPNDPSQVGQGIRAFAEEGFDLVIGVGFANEPAITATAKEFKDVKFAVIDAVSSEKDNVASLVFREQEGSFLVGYIAGKLTQTGVLGFIGGMDIPLIHKFEAGYRAGVEYACKESGIQCKVLVNYVGNTPQAWNDPGKAKEIAAAQVAQGADIIYHASGASGLGLIDYVKQKKCIKASELPAGVKFIRDPFKDVPKYPAYEQACKGETRPIFFIGVDADQNYLGDTDNNPATLNHGLTSMQKRVDVAVYDVIKSVVMNNFTGGIHEFSLKNNGVAYALDEYNKALIPASVVARLEVLKQKIVKGEIKVPSGR